MIYTEREQEVQNRSKQAGAKFMDNFYSQAIGKMESEISHLQRLITENQSKINDVNSDYISKLQAQTNEFANNSKKIHSSYDNDLQNIKRDFDRVDSELTKDKQRNLNNIANTSVSEVWVRRTCFGSILQTESAKIDL